MPNIPLDPWYEKILDDGEVVRFPRDIVTIRGQFLKWKVNDDYFHPPVRRKRNAVWEFSRASRLRIMCYMASLNWKLCYPASFITLTYPDLDHFPYKKERNQHRHEFWRYVETYLGRQVPAIWRVEYPVRKSGKWEGKSYPHYHLMAFGVKWIPWQKVREFWGKALNHDGKLVTEIRRIQNERKAGHYTSKYTAKRSESSLVNVAYLNNDSGRHWGIHRKNLLPLHAERVVENPECRRMALARKIALEGRTQLNEWGYESFKLLGPLAQFVAAIIFDGALDDMLE